MPLGVALISMVNRNRQADEWRDWPLGGPMQRWQKGNTEAFAWCNMNNSSSLKCHIWRGLGLLPPGFYLHILPTFKRKALYITVINAIDNREVVRTLLTENIQVQGRYNHLLLKYKLNNYFL